MSTPDQGLAPNAMSADQKPADQKPAGSGLNRRRFLGGAAAAALTAGAVGLEPLVKGGSQAEAAQEVGPHLGSARLTACVEYRDAMKARMVAVGMPTHLNNGDEDALPGFIGSYSKGLRHNALGEPDAESYNSLMLALATGSQAKFDIVFLGGDRHLTNPQAGLAFDPVGLDAHQFVQPPAPAFSSAEEAGEMVEHYWQALLRDVNLNRYRTHPLAQEAIADLNRLSDFRGPRENGKVSPQTLFRDPFPGCTAGPYISQFMWLDTPFGVEFVDRRMRTLVAGTDYGTTFSDWLAIQNGNVPGVEHFNPQRRYVLTGRDMAQWVHIDVLFQAYFNACLILGQPTTIGGIQAPVNPGNPYVDLRKEDGFATLGGPFYKTILCEVATRALKAVWYQKWFVHRRLRPEEFGGRVHVTKSSLKSYPIHNDVLHSAAVDRVHAKYGTYLLPLAFKEGSPTHPSYGAGHATVAGACVTMLKALFDEDYAIPHPKVPTPDGQALRDLEGVTLTVGGELNKLASNVATGRNIGGVHWRSDAYWSILLGEQVALHVLVDGLAALNEIIEPGLQFTSFTGRKVTVNKEGYTFA
jgi:hypothetical protein